MKRFSTLRPIAAALLAAAPLTFVVPASPAAAIPVFDPTNYAQNVLQAARALEQINNQVKSLQNEAAMVQDMARNLKRIDFPELERLKSSMAKVGRLIDEAKGIDFRVDRLDERLRAMFPGSVDAALRSDRRVVDARARLDAATAGLRQSMAVQAQVAENVRGDAGLLEELVGRSQSADGALAAAQATNQLLALSAKQQLQLQSLLAASLREASVERARRVQAEGEARESTRRFLGLGRAYTPQ
ncbi:MAG TPA: P-type conjugative transfer protein TrbJ [Allosphingosinicella sp.]